MSLRTPNQFSRRLIVGCVYGVVGTLAGMLLGLIPGSAIVLVIVCGVLGAWMGSRQECDSSISSDEGRSPSGRLTRNRLTARHTNGRMHL